MRNTIHLMADVRYRVLGNPEISTDGYVHYIRAVDEAFQGEAHHGIVDNRHLVYYASLTFFFLFLASRALEDRKWR